MKNTDRTDLNNRIALFRYEHIIPILNNDFVDKSAMQYCRRISQNPVTYIDGKAIKVSANTIRHWAYLYKKYGFDGLLPKTRSDAGESRVLTSQAKSRIEELKTSNFRMTATAIYLKLISEGIILKKDTSLSSVTRFVAKIEPSLNLVKYEDMRAFEMSHVNDLWQIDTTYCSYIKIDKKSYRTYLIMIVDDCSRMIVGYGFFLEDNALNVQSVLKQAILKYGIPKKVYTDNGSPYKNNQLSLIAAQLQIQLLRAQPYHGNQKGKIERAFKSVKEQWMHITDFSLFSSTNDIDKAFSQYVNQKNQAKHRSLKDMSPLTRFMSEPEHIKRLPQTVIDQAFYHTVTRKVSTDATIRLNTIIFETSQKYIKKIVTIKYLPDLSAVYLFDMDSYIEIKEVNKIDNASIKRNSTLYSGDES